MGSQSFFAVWKPCRGFGGLTLQRSRRGLVPVPDTRVGAQSLPGLDLCFSHLWITWSSPTPSPCEVPLLLKLLPALLNPACLLSGHGRRKSSSTGLFLVAVFCTGGDATNPYRVPHFLAEASSFSDFLDFDETPYFLRILINPTFSFSTF